MIGNVLLKKGHPLLAKHFQRQIANLSQLLENMERSQQAMATEKYTHSKKQLSELEELYKSVFKDI